MTSISEKKIGGQIYLYRSTSKRVNGEVKTETEYLGPKGKSQRQEVSEDMMGELSQVLLKPGLDEKEIKKIARKYDLDMSVISLKPRLISLENNLKQKKLFIWIK